MLKRLLKGLIRSYAQSDENSLDPVLKTRYYKAMKDKAWDEIIQIMNKLDGYEACFEIKKAGELVYMKKTSTGRIMDITITVVKTGALETAVDIYSASRGSMGDFGANYRNIKVIFAALDNHFMTK